MWDRISKAYLSVCALAIVLALTGFYIGMNVSARETAGLSDWAWRLVYIAIALVTCTMLHYRICTLFDSTEPPEPRLD